MTALNNHSIEEHQEFILDQLIPLIVGYARTSGSQSKVVVLASFFSLVKILQAEGMQRSALIQAVDAVSLSEPKAPEVLH